ncbi:uncharacterized protein LOC127260494 [Andrographis paniculata]|uniref:uncharacterized protein LOC127260494 n=1 Tax=Andrographis paniculata TaxID=175694 RepID=UPI0021E83FEB|nr:uncharacterized protein LOC127260494 [Andrographis paniculata]
MSVFLWRLFHRRIPVDEALRKMGLPIVSRYQCCRESKTIEHLFLSSAVAQCVWHHFADLFRIQLPGTHAPHLMVSAWRLSSPHVRSIHAYIPLLVLWFLWTARNNAKHRGPLACWPPSTTALVRGFSPCFLSRPSPPSPGSSAAGLSAAGAAGIIRDATSAPLVAFQVPLPHATNTMAELQAIRSSVDLAVARGLLPLWIETDSACSISLLSSSTGHWTLQPCLHHLRLQLRTIEWRISHIYREGNQVADNLANTSVPLPQMRILEPADIPTKARGFIHADAAGLPCFRFR